MLGGEGGDRAPVASGADAAGGESVDLAESPLTLGAIRPYRSVYADYEASARQSLARQPLPPALEERVQRYFSAISPPRSER
jgi:hypothetical protein